MNRDKLVQRYKTEQDNKKKFEILRKILAKCVDERDASVNQWVSEINKYNPPTHPLSQVSNCPNCGGMMRKKKVVEAPPRAEFTYLVCDRCGVERVVGYLKPQARALVHLRDRNIYSDSDYLKSFIQSHSADELKKVLVKVVNKSKNPENRARSQLTLGNLFKRSEPEKAEQFLQSAKNHYQSRDKNKFVNICQDLISLKIKNNKPKEALKIIDELGEYAEKEGQTRLVITCNINKGVALELMDEYEEAVDFYGEALNLADEGGHPRLFNQASSRLKTLLEKAEEMEEDLEENIKEDIGEDISQ